MKIILILTARGALRYDGKKAISLAYEILQALATLLALQIGIDPREFKPEFIEPGLLRLVGEGTVPSGGSLLSETVAHSMALLWTAAGLFEATENFVQGEMLNRQTESNDARYPVPVIYSDANAAGCLLAYESKRDLLLCSEPNWKEIAQEAEDLLKALAEVHAIGYEPKLEIDGTTVDFPVCSSRWFAHGSGKGFPVSANATITGIYHVANQVELVIDGNKRNRVQQASLSDEAALELKKYQVPFTCSIIFSEASPHFPLATKRGKVLIEKAWDVKIQNELDLDTDPDTDLDADTVLDADKDTDTE